MIVSVDMKDGDVQRIKELKNRLEASTRSEIIRAALREFHKKIFDKNITSVIKQKQEKSNE